MMVVSKSSLVIGRKVQSVINQLPHIDGHFWIVRDGKIVDPYFKEYDLLVKFHNGKKGSFIHKPADNMTQLVMFAIVRKLITNAGYIDADEFLFDYIKINGRQPEHSYCLFNAMMEAQENGGDIIFGSWGFELSNGSKFYEYGGEDWKGVKNFLQQDDDFIRNRIT